MSDFFKYTLIDPLTSGDYIGITLCIIMWLCFLAVALIVGYGILWVINFAFMPKKDGFGKVIDKQFIPEHDVTTMQYNAALKMSLPHTDHYDDEWRLLISLPYENGSELTDEVSVTEEYYSKVNFNDGVHIQYTEGRLWVSMNICGIY